MRTRWLSLRPLTSCRSLNALPITAHGSSMPKLVPCLRPAAPIHPRLFSSEPKATENKEKAEQPSKSKSSLLHSLANLSDDQIVEQVRKGKLASYRLEGELKAAVAGGYQPDCERAVRIRRKFLSAQLHDLAAKGEAQESAEDVVSTKVSEDFAGLPYNKFDFKKFYLEVLGKNCENVVGYVPIPVGTAGPLLLDGRRVLLPMATTEGALVASTHRGCRAITESGGATTHCYRDSMTRAPMVQLPSAARAVACMKWIQVPENEAKIKAAFNSTTRFGKLNQLQCTLAGRTLHIRFGATTGDAMGMNMISKGCLTALTVLEEHFPDLEVMSLSGNFCTDKKPAAVNWINGRGKGVVCEAVLSGHVVTNVLKCTVDSLVQTNINKNLIGSSLAGSIGGNNAHAANVVAALFLATGQDPAQVVESANCMTLMESCNEGHDVRVSVTLPSLEVGTIGGGTELSSQKSGLEILGVAGAHPTTPGANAQQLARCIAGAVLAGEISLMSALASNHLVSAHMKLNRKPDHK
eukprot:gb/GEZN01006064.1/.p1 GENE.gb/GEZN01006064.1/~~gb/GEZN01006064.1/.p1  ORF type:complete len:523 (-),score=83.11 gb/GEZN01006064.1/:81-1649(-)